MRSWAQHNDATFINVLDYDDDIVLLALFCKAKQDLLSVLSKQTVNIYARSNESITV